MRIDAASLPPEDRALKAQADHLERHVVSLASASRPARQIAGSATRSGCRDRAEVLRSTDRR